MKTIRFSIITLSLIGFLFASCKKDCTNMVPTPVIVDAGAGQSIKVPADSVTLTGTVKSGQTTGTTYLWSLISGPNVPVIANNNSLQTGVSNLVQGTYVFQFQATNNVGQVGLDTTIVVVKGLNTSTITIQPGKATGQDAMLCYAPGLYDGNGLFGTYPYFGISAWTYNAQGAPFGIFRAFIKFTALDTLPATATITSAKLSLSPVSTIPYSGFVGDSYYPGSPYNSYGDNKLWLQRATANWDQATITYNNQPAVTTVNEVELPASTSEFNYSVTDLDITQLIKDMKTTPGTNFGFCMRLQDEEIYRQMNFDASEAKADSSTGPKLVVTYQY